MHKSLIRSNNAGTEHGIKIKNFIEKKKRRENLTICMRTWPLNTLGVATEKEYIKDWKRQHLSAAWGQ